MKEMKKKQVLKKIYYKTRIFKIKIDFKGKKIYVGNKRSETRYRRMRQI